MTALTCERNEIVEFLFLGMKLSGFVDERHHGCV
jgi:hypothetical protein